jgi:hypothetical protein
MVTTILVPALMVVVGALVYALAANPKVSELGRLCAAAGLIGLAIEFGGRAVHLP